MDKNILTHRTLVADKLEVITKMAAGDKQAAIKELYTFHITRVKDFQHERLVHLLVTLFFGGLLVLSLISVVAITLTTQVTDQTTLMSILASILSFLLLIVTLFYIWHYFKLENRTQKLYPLTDKLYSLLTPSNK